MDKESQTKTGKIYAVKVTDTGAIELLSQSDSWPFGILSLHLHGGAMSGNSSGDDAQISASTFVSIGCSDGKLRLVNCDLANGAYTFIEEIKTNEE